MRAPLACALLRPRMAADGRLLQQHAGAIIEIGPDAILDHLREIDARGAGREQHARQRALILIDISVLGARR